MTSRKKTSNPASLLRLLPHLAFICAYVFLDWVSFIEPLHGLNITSWNPPPALGLVYWLRYGKGAAFPWFVALLITEGSVHSYPIGSLETLGLSLSLVFFYSCLGETMRRWFSLEKIFENRSGLFIWLAIAATGTFLNAVSYIGVLCLSGKIPMGEWFVGTRQYWVGDLVGIMITMPLFWLLASEPGRLRLRQAMFRLETLAYCVCMAGLIWSIFIHFHQSTFQHFYFMFLPIVWAAARHGLAGTALIAVIMQLSIVSASASGFSIAMPLFELQLLLSILSLASLFIGIVVDEQKNIAVELNRSLRMAAASEMAGALAHELNQPITALVAYGQSCQELLARNETGPIFKDALRRLINESNRAAGVVHGLRDFLRTGAMHIESVELGAFVLDCTHAFSERAQPAGVSLAVQPIPLVLAKLDRVQIALVMRNLLDNAFDAVAALPEGQRFVNVVTDIRENREILMTVTDSGPGVSDNMVQGLFEPFVSSKSSGMGLGLALSRTIIEAHGGKLWVEIGNHGVFKFALPLMETRHVQ